MLCCVFAAVLADRVGLCSWLPRCSGHGLDGSELGVGEDDSAGSDCGAREHLPAAFTDHAGKLEQEFCSAYYRPKHTVSRLLLSNVLRAVALLPQCNLPFFLRVDLIKLASMSVHPSVRTYVLRSVHPQNVSPIRLKFGV